jgi:uncharacterized protein (TIGR03032 family)
MAVARERLNASGAPLFVSAWNDSGGGYLTRLLDGHPALAVYPFELQLGTGLEPCGYDEWFPAKYRWPVLPDERRDAFDAFANEELRAAMGSDAAGKFAGFALDLDVEQWRKAFDARVDGSDRGGVVSAWLDTFFASWRDGPGDTRDSVVGHCPVLALDWDLVLTDLPGARMVHVVRTPYAGFADTKRRRPGMSAEGYAARWSLVNTVAALHAARRPEKFRVVRYEDLVHAPRETMTALAEWLGLEFDDALLAPTWNGKPLADMKPFGGIPVNSLEYERANIADLGADDRRILGVESAAARALFSIADLGPDTGSERENFTAAADNLSFARIATKDVAMSLEYETEGDFWGLLNELGVALLVTREYEHLLLLLGGNDGAPWQSAMPIPHPSGAFVNPGDGSLVVSSTRTPNQIMWFRRITDDDWCREIVPTDLTRDRGTVYLPSLTRVLPGTLYIHDVVMSGDALYATVTGHNFVAKIDAESGWERVWWPRVLDHLGADAFRSNWLQLNSIGLGPRGLADAYLTAFADETSGPKPWKEGYGPEGRGVVFSAESREVVLRGLTCPHSATRHDQALWLCDSGFGAVGVVENLDRGVESSAFATVTRLPGFTRGLAFAGSRAIVGLSKVIERYEPYAPGLEPSASRCGLAILDAHTGVVEAQLWWPNGLQIYEVQILAGITRPTLPSAHPGGDDRHLRFIG